MKTGYWVLYQSLNKQFVALTDEVADPLPAGIEAKFVGAERPDTDRYQWDPASLAFVPSVPARLLPKWIFIQRFTDAERLNLFGHLFSTLTDPQKKRITALLWYLLYLDTINLDDSAIQAGIQYLETVGILAAGRAAQILS